jgi:signal transduction histidine kinase
VVQAVANLVDNAVKYTRPGGQVHVEARAAGDEAVIVVRDTGIGIPPHESDRVWDRSFRGDASRSKRGLGLGLSLVRAVARAHNGTVELSSTPGVGSEFTLRLPLAHAARPAVVA